MINFRHKLDSREDIETEGVVGLFRTEEKAVLLSRKLPAPCSAFWTHL